MQQNLYLEYTLQSYKIAERGAKFPLLDLAGVIGDADIALKTISNEGFLWLRQDWGRGVLTLNGAFFSH